MKKNRFEDKFWVKHIKWFVAAGLIYLGWGLAGGNIDRAEYLFAKIILLIEYLFSAIGTLIEYVLSLLKKYWKELIGLATLLGWGGVAKYKKGRKK